MAVQSIAAMRSGWGGVRSDCAPLRMDLDAGLGCGALVDLSCAWICDGGSVCVCVDLG